MSLKHFHLFFIAISLGLMAFLTYWSLSGQNRMAMLGVALTGLTTGLVYLAWFLRKYRRLS